MGYNVLTFGYNLRAQDADSESSKMNKFNIEKKSYRNNHKR